MIFDKSAKIIQWGKDNLFNKWHCKKWITIYKIMKLDPYLIPYTKFNSKWVRDKQQHILYSTGKYSHYLIITLYTHTHTHTHIHTMEYYSALKRKGILTYSTVLWAFRSLEKEMATHSSILAWRIPWTEEPWQATVHGVAKSQTWLSMYTPWTFRILGLKWYVSHKKTNIVWFHLYEVFRVVKNHRHKK